MDSHGVSYAALTVFNDELLQISPRNDTYKNMPYGKRQNRRIKKRRTMPAHSSRLKCSVVDIF